MKNKKAISWEKLSEGILTASEITLLETKRHPVTMTLLGVQPTGVAGSPTLTGSIQIVPVRGPSYNVQNNITGVMKVNRKPYKYLSCAVRLAVKEYKSALRTGKWRILTKS